MEGAAYCNIATQQNPKVPDPYYGYTRDFEFALELLKNACEGLLEELIHPRPLIIFTNHLSYFVRYSPTSNQYSYTRIMAHFVTL